MSALNRSLLNGEYNVTNILKASACCVIENRGSSQTLYTSAKVHSAVEVCSAQPHLLKAKF
jgi:hypothetical protein